MVEIGSPTNRSTALDFGDGGHLLYSNKGGTYLWTRDNNVELDRNFGPIRVNGKGDVLGSLLVNNVFEPVIRLADGSFSSLKDLAGDTTGWGDLNDPRDINDNCDVIGYGVGPTGARTPFLIDGNGCETVDIEGEFFRVDGGSAFTKVGEPADVRLRVENGFGTELTGVNVTSVTVVEDDSGGDGDRRGRDRHRSARWLRPVRRRSGSAT